MSELRIRPASESDLEAINEIYNYYVLHSTCTYQEQPETSEDRKTWFTERSEKHPVTVALSDEQIVGWGSISLFRTRAAYRHTVENAVYVRHGFHRQGIGSLLLKDLVERARAVGHHAIIGAIDAEQAGSIALHSKFGFQMVGRLKQVGFKFERWLDVIYMELML